MNLSRFLFIVDLVQNSPVTHQPGTVDARERLVEFFTDPIRVRQKRTRNELNRPRRNIG